MAGSSEIEFIIDCMAENVFIFEYKDAESIFFVGIQP